MLIRFLGADRTVTGSSHLLEINGLRILLDCGIYQGSRDEARQLNSTVAPDPQSIDAVILSHGHLDHSGKLPVLLLAGFHGPIYCTSATSEVTRIILKDSAKIQEEDADYLNRRQADSSAPPIKPLYRVSDVDAVLKSMKFVECGQKFDLGKGVSFTFFDAGHILGSCYVLIEWTEQAGPSGPGLSKAHSLLFTGDIGRYDTPIIRDPQPPPGPVELLITESTYGGRSHGPISAVEPQLIDAIQAVQRTNSRLIIPSFAVGRTQTMLYYIAKLVAKKQIAPIRIYIDSPMGVEVSKVYSRSEHAFDEETMSLIGTNHLIAFSKVTLATTGDESRKINNDKGPCVIIASSPTCEFGRVLHHIKQSVENPNDLVLFVGYIPPNTLGRRLQDGQKRVHIFDRWYDVKFQVRTIHGLSAHADADELMRFLAPALSPDTTAYIVHGDPDQSEAFASRMIAKGVKSATVPAMTTSTIVFGSSDQPKQSTGPASNDGD